MTKGIKISAKKLAMLIFCCLLLCFSVALFAACGGDDDDKKPPAKPTLTSITITNKAALQAEWKGGDPDRTVNISLSPASFTEANTEITITSSNTQVITVVDGNKLHAVKAGTATVTAAAEGKSDTVEITVSKSVESVTITNKAELEAEMVIGLDSGADRTIAVTLAPSDFTVENTPITVTSSNPAAIAIDGMTVKAVAPGTATVSVKAGGVTETFTVTARNAITSPVITVAESVKGDVGEEITVTATAATSDGTDLTESMVITPIDSGIEYVGGKFVANATGAYTVKYAVTDSRVESGEQTTEETVTVNVYRKIFSYTDGNTTVVNDFNPTTGDMVNDQVVDLSNSGYLTTKFNMAPGKVYYAEATFTFVGSVDAANKAGLSHMTEEATVDRLVADVDRGDRNAHYAEFMDKNGTWGYKGTGDDSPFSWRLVEYRGLTDSNPRQVKIAVARDGDYFYYFVNDQYVNMVMPVDYRDVDTVPGLFGHKNAGGNASKILYLSGDDAKAKLLEVLGEGNDIVCAYNPNEWYDSAKKEDLFTVNERSTARGINFDLNATDYAYNSSTVTNYIYFDGDFTFSYEFKPTALKSQKQSWGMQRPIHYIEFRSFTYGEPFFQLGMRANPDDPQLSNIEMLIDRTDGVEDTEGWGQINGVNCTTVGVKFTVSRKVYADEYAVWYISAQSLANPAQVVKRQFVWNDTTNDKHRFDREMLFLWQNTGISGQFSNIKWDSKAIDALETGVTFTTSFDAAQFGEKLLDTAANPCSWGNATNSATAEEQAAGIARFDNPSGEYQYNINKDIVAGEYYAVVKYKTPAPSGDLFGFYFEAGNNQKTRENRFSIFVPASETANQERYAIFKCTFDSDYLYNSVPQGVDSNRTKVKLAVAGMTSLNGRDNKFAIEDCKCPSIMRVMFFRAPAPATDAE